MTENPLNTINDTATDYPRDACIHELFEAQAKRTPDGPAVVHRGATTTYRELNEQANRLAHLLRDLGVGPDALVGVMMERSVELVAALLGILKAGGAYVPLPPDYPPSRLRLMRSDARAEVILTHGDLLASSLAGDATVIHVNTDRRRIAACPEDDPGPCATATDLAYVMYTSGSTGRPNGVMIPHRGVVRLLFGVDYVPVDRRQTFLLLAPTAFDSSTFELWAPLLHGARLAVSSHPFPTRRLIEEDGVTCLWLTSALFNTIIDQNPDVLRSVPHLFLGGEALSVSHVRRGLDVLPETRIVNCYGPTESATFATTYTVPRDLDPEADSVPIGRPIANTQVYVLDTNLKPVPVGSPGELYIAGDGLARGYLNRPKLTAERFVADPFDGSPGARMYKTGDRCRLPADGNIRFLGRIDWQVKVRGMRIELGEIETVLKQHPHVAECVVGAEGEGADRHLVAYLTTRDQAKPSADELRRHLAGRLPGYMAPAAFVLLDAMPLTPVGKIDRRALPGLRETGRR